MHMTSVTKTSAHSHNSRCTFKNMRLSLPGGPWPRAREGFLPVVKTKEARDQQETWAAASKPQEALVLSLPVEGVGAWGASCLCFHSQGCTDRSLFVCVSQTG
ncbi:hypothetical protein CHARACLAT_011159 [Characodon lateralis]|uniref:Uncharacterized protein n=1 Tax=Characodon lateralis TaxID=208331 RepID=A0ABU7E8T9_9TELE|nr:hypothetical protein [Characodon lateralis]